MEDLNISSIAVVGAGTLGRGIALVSLLSGYKIVYLNDLRMEILEESREKIRNELEILTDKSKFTSKYDYIIESTENFNYNQYCSQFIKVGILSQGVGIDEIMERLVISEKLETAIPEANFIIEAVPEILEVKQDIFEKISSLSKSSAIIASNTSSIKISDLAEKYKHPERVIGMHFHSFNPLVCRFMEITPAPKTSDSVLNTTKIIGERFPSLGKEKIVFMLQMESFSLLLNRLDVTGAIVSRWINDQIYDMNYDIDQLIYSLGEFETLDKIGLDVVYYSSKYLEEHISPDFKPSKFIERLFKEGRLGKKLGIGCYEWDGDDCIKKEIPKNTDILKLISKIAKPGLISAARLNEACRLLEEGVVSDYRLIDEAVKHVNESPGPFELGKYQYKRWSKMLEDFVKKSGRTYLTPCNLMKSGEFLKYTTTNIN